MSTVAPAWPRRAALVAAALIVAGLSLLIPVVAVGAQEAPSTGETSVTPVPTPHIIPEPNSGHEPVDAGDPGGALQLLLLTIIVVAVAGITLNVVRQSRRARADRD